LGWSPELNQLYGIEVAVAVCIKKSQVNTGNI
jgi:hypothetical protein